MSYVDQNGEPAEAFTTVQMHAGDLPIGTLRAIERQLAPAFGKEWLR